MCTPRPRWRPAHVRQIKVPNLGEAHWGEGAEQSTQVELPGRFWRSASCVESVSWRVKGDRGVGGRGRGRGAPWTWFPGRLPTS